MWQIGLDMWSGSSVGRAIRYNWEGTGLESRFVTAFISFPVTHIFIFLNFPFYYFILFSIPQFFTKSIKHTFVGLSQESIPSCFKRVCFDLNCFLRNFFSALEIFWFDMGAAMLENNLKLFYDNNIKCIVTCVFVKNLPNHIKIL